jgi:predicted RNA methylase
VFFELGCGKGRVCCFFGRRKLRRVIGIELDDSLCEVAQKNVARLRKKRTTIEIRCEDMVASNLSEGTIYYMFNPFGAETMCHVLQTIKHSLETAPRKITIIYYNPVCADLFHAAEWLKQIDEFKTLTGRRVTFWKNIS